jgi:hypothetical protein
VHGSESDPKQHENAWCFSSAKKMAHFVTTEEIHLEIGKGWRKFVTEYDHVVTENRHRLLRRQKIFQNCKTIWHFFCSFAT